MSEHPRTQLIELRWETYAALKRIREDESYRGFDAIVRAMIQKHYPHFAVDL